MKEFTLLITILFNFPNGEHQEIQVERKQMSEVDCHIELEKQDDVSINFFGNTIDLFFECTPSLEDTYLLMMVYTQRISQSYYQKS